MRFTLFSLLVLGVALSSFAGADEDDIKGIWVSEGGKSRIEVAQKEDGSYYGKIIWLKDKVYAPGDPEEGKVVHDRENPDPEKRDQPIEGLVIMQDFRGPKRGVWSNGLIYDPESGKTYKGKITMNGKDELHLRGYIGVSLIGRTSVWKRYKPEEKEEK